MQEVIYFILFKDAKGKWDAYVCNETDVEIISRDENNIDFYACKSIVPNLKRKYYWRINEAEISTSEITKLELLEHVPSTGNYIIISN